MAEHLSNRVATPRETLIADLYQVAPGRKLTFETGKPLHESSLATNHFPELRFPDERDYVDEFTRILETALIASTRSSTPWTATLSGGLDSSTVVCYLDRLDRAGKAPVPIETFSLIFPGMDCDEQEFIAPVAQLDQVHATLKRPYPYDRTQATRLYQQAATNFRARTIAEDGVATILAAWQLFAIETWLSGAFPALAAESKNHFTHRI